MIQSSLILLLVLLVGAPLQAQSTPTLAFGPTPVLHIGVDVPMADVRVRVSTPLPLCVTGAAVTFRGTRTLYPLASLNWERFFCPGGGVDSKTTSMLGIGWNVHLPNELDPDGDGTDVFIEVGPVYRWAFAKLGWAAALGVRF